MVQEGKRNRNTRTVLRSISIAQRCEYGRARKYLKFTRAGSGMRRRDLREESEVWLSFDRCAKFKSDISKFKSDISNFD